MLRIRRRDEDGRLVEAKGSSMRTHAKTIARMTDENDHTGARIYLAQHVLKDKKLTKIGKAIRTIHETMGSMTPSLLQFRDVEFWRMLRMGAKKKLSPGDYDMIVMSF